MLTLLLLLLLLLLYVYTCQARRKLSFGNEIYHPKPQVFFFIINHLNSDSANFRRMRRNLIFRLALLTQSLTYRDNFSCMYICVCMFVCVCMRACVCVCVCVCARARVRAYVCMQYVYDILLHFLTKYEAYLITSITMRGVGNFRRVVMLH
jgi:hypothetical protein